jgi:hypothetical protein
MKHKLPNFTKWSAALLAVALAVACSNSSGDAMHKSASEADELSRYMTTEMDGKSAPMKLDMDKANEQYRPEGRVVERKIIHTGSITVEIESYATARKKLEALVEGAGGFIANADLHHAQDTVSSATLVLRVPAESLAHIMRELGKLGAIHAESLHAQDVTEEYFDIDARLRNARALETRLIELVATNTAALSDLLMVEQELARVREQIEVYQGQLNRLANQTSLATLTASFVTQETYVAATDPSFGQRVSDTFHSSIQAFEDAAASFALFFVAALPWMFPLGFIAWIARRRYMRVRRDQVARASAGAK